MDQYRETRLRGRVAWIGAVEDRDATLRSRPRECAYLRFSGIEGETHSGITRPSCTRTEQLHDIGTEIRNVRQLTVVSSEELAEIAGVLGVDTISPSLLGANLVISGIPRFTLVPPSSRLQFPSGGTLAVDMRNLPCNLPAREIEMDLPGAGRGFKAAAEDRRGVTAWVEREGTVAIGDSARLLVPSQPAWPELYG